MADCLGRTRVPARGRCYERFGIIGARHHRRPCSDLAAHAALAADPTWQGRVIPTFRPDRYLEPAQPGWRDAVGRLGRGGRASRSATTPAIVRALEERRGYFIAHGADLGRPQPRRRGHRPTRARRGGAHLRRRTGRRGHGRRRPLAFRRHMLLEMARMSCDDGLVMTLHPGVRRNHHRRRSSGSGPDTGHDIPIRVEFTDALRPLLERFGTHPGFHLVAVHARRDGLVARARAAGRLLPVACTSGVPWWFLDAPDAIRRFRAAVTETAGFSRTSGFVDDTRAFCSIPARHDMSRRVDAGFLARLVAEHRLDEDEALETAVDLGHQPARRRCSSCERPRLSRAGGQARAAPRCGWCTSGSGNFFRAHQAWYTDHAADAADWGYRRFRRPGQRARGADLTAQDGLYTLRHAGRRRRPVSRWSSSLSRAHAADRPRLAWLGYFGSPEVGAVTITVTEAGYLRGADGGLDLDRPEVEDRHRSCCARDPRGAGAHRARPAGRRARRPAPGRRGPLASGALRQPRRQRCDRCSGCVARPSRPARPRPRRRGSTSRSLS